MKKTTQWKHFKQNYLWPFIFINGIGVISLVMELFRGSDAWWMSMFFFIIGSVVLPLGNYLSWKGIVK